MKFNHIIVDTRHNTNIELFGDKKLIATATINHELRTIWASYLTGPGKKAVSEEIPYSYNEMDSLTRSMNTQATINDMINRCKS